MLFIRWGELGLKCLNLKYIGACSNILVGHLEVQDGMILLFVFVFLFTFAPSTLRSDLGNRFSTQASGRVDTMGNCMTILWHYFDPSLWLHCPCALTMAPWLNIVNTPAFHIALQRPHLYEWRLGIGKIELDSWKYFCWFLDKSPPQAPHTSKQNCTCIPYICQFWYTTALARPLKVHQKGCKFASK